MQLTLFELFVRIIPESFLIILAGYALARKRIVWQWYLLAAVLHALITFGIKHINIADQYHMILSAIAAVILLVAINKIKAVHAILSTLLCFVLSVLAEFANMAILTFIFHLDVNQIFEQSDAISRTLYGLPSLAVFALAILTFTLIRFNRKKATDKNDVV